MHDPSTVNDLIFRLRKRAEIRRNIPTRKSVQEGTPDRIAALLDEAAEGLAFWSDPAHIRLVFEQAARISDAFADGQKQMAEEEGSDDGLVAGESTARAISTALRRRAEVEIRRITGNDQE